MAEIFHVSQEFSNFLDFFKSIDIYERSTNHRLRIWESRTTKHYCCQRNRKNLFEDKFFYYEFYIDCVCGPKHKEARIPDHCSMKLVCRLNIDEKKYEVKFWEPTHNHEPNPKKAKMELWVDKMKKKVASIKKRQRYDNLEENDQKLMNRIALKKISTKIQKNIAQSPVDQQKLKITYLLGIFDTFQDLDEEFEETVVPVQASGDLNQSNPPEVRAEEVELDQNTGDSDGGSIKATVLDPVSGDLNQSNLPEVRDAEEVELDQNTRGKNIRKFLNIILKNSALSIIDGLEKLFQTMD